MSVNNNNNNTSSMVNTSYSGSTSGHTSGAVNIKNTYKQPLTTHSTSFEEDLINAPAMPIKSFSHFARKFSTKLSTTSTNKPFYAAAHTTSFNSSSTHSCQANNSSLANKSADSLLDSSASSLSNYSALFSR